MDQKINKQIQEWLNTPRDQRNVPAGAMLLLRLNHNQVLYNNILHKPTKLHDKLEYELKKYLQWRLQQNHARAGGGDGGKGAANRC